MKNYITTIGALLSFFSFCNCFANINDNFISDFKAKSLSSCDATFQKIDTQPGLCEDMFCRDILVNAWAECWHRSINSELDKRFQSLSKTDPNELQFEKNLQKKFDSAVQAACGKDCGSGMRGISYNYCRVSAYKYRLAQINQINSNSFTIPSKYMFGLDKVKPNKHKEKNTYFYNAFIDDVCHMPNTVWKTGTPPQDCRKKSLKELSDFEFTDDVCDLS